MSYVYIFSLLKEMLPNAEIASFGCNLYLTGELFFNS